MKLEKLIKNINHKGVKENLKYLDKEMKPGDSLQNLITEMPYEDRETRKAIAYSIRVGSNIYIENKNLYEVVDKNKLICVTKNKKKAEKIAEKKRRGNVRTINIECDKKSREDVINTIKDKKLAQRIKKVTKEMTTHMIYDKQNINFEQEKDWLIFASAYAGMLWTKENLQLYATYDNTGIIRITPYKNKQAEKLENLKP